MTEAISAEVRHGILQGLVNSDEEVRRLAVEQVMLLPIEEAAEHLGTSLGDGAWRVRKAAVERLVACRQDPRIQEMLVASLSDGENPGRRNAAFEALVACGTGVTERLVAELSSSDVDVRKLVIDALAAIGDADSRKPLRGAVEDADPNVRASAAEALGVVGGIDEIALLLKLTVDRDEDVLVRLSCLRALSRMEAGVGVGALGDAVDSSPLRPAAFELLGFSADPEAIEILIKGLGSGSRSSREAAMGALLRTFGRIDDMEATRLIGRVREVVAENAELVASSCERLEFADLAGRMVLIQFLGLLDEPLAVVPILEAGRDEAIEELADATLMSMADRLPAALAEVWDDLDFDLKIRACRLLGRTSGPVSEHLLIEALATGDVPLRCAASAAIGRGGFFGRLPDLVLRLESAAREGDTESEEEVASIVQAIVELAEHPGAIETGIDVQLVEILSSRLAGAVEPVRLAIAKVLARLGREQDQDVLGYLIKDESPAVRRAAVGALARFDFDLFRDALRLALGDEASVVRIAAATVLGNSNRSEALDDLAQQVRDEDPRVVAVVIRSIGRLYQNRSASLPEIEALIEESLGDEPLVALAGIEALMEIGGEVAAEMVKRALRRTEPDVVRSAVSCLGAHGDSESLAELLPLLMHSDWSVRASVVEAVSGRAYRKGLPSLLRRLEVEDDAFVREAMLRAVERLED